MVSGWAGIRHRRLDNRHLCLWHCDTSNSNLIKRYRYIGRLLMSLMRGPQVEEVVLEVKEDDEWGKSPLRVLPALLASDEGNNQGAEGGKEDTGMCVGLYHVL